MKTKAKSGNKTAGRNARSTGFTMAMGTAGWAAMVAKAQAEATPGWRTPKGGDSAAADKVAGAARGGRNAPTTGLKSPEELCPDAREFREAFAQALRKLRGEEPGAAGADEQEALVAQLGHLDVVVLVRRIGA